MTFREGIMPIRRNEKNGKPKNGGGESPHMTAKEYLNQARLLDQQINAKLDRINRLRALAERVTTTMGGEVVSHTRNVTSQQDQINCLIDEENILQSEIRQLMALKKEVSEVLNLIDDPDCRLLLELRYLCFREWDEIADVMHFHARTVYKIHGRALQKLTEILDSDAFRAIRGRSEGACRE